MILLAHLVGYLEQYPFFNVAREGGWYDFGFLIGTGSPLLGALRRR